MTHTTGNNSFSAPHTDMGSSYLSELRFNSEYTRRDTDIQSDGVDCSVRDGHNTGHTAPEVPYSLQQWTHNRQSRNSLGLERPMIAPVLSDPHLDDLLGHGTSSSPYVASIQRSYSPETMSPQSIDSLPPASVFSMGSQGSSIGSYPLSVGPTHTTYSLAGTMPAHSLVPIGELPEFYSDAGLVQSSCFFKDILQSPCAERFRSREDFCDHMLSHFGKFGPPPEALCIFCDRDFQNADPQSTWVEYLDHIWDQHFRNGMVLEQMRPDFVTWRYLLDIGALTEARYKEICEMASERQPWKYPWLRPADWESPREKARKLAEKRREEEENVVGIVDRSTRRKDKERSSRQGQSSRQGKDIADGRRENLLNRLSFKKEAEGGEKKPGFFNRAIALARNAKLSNAPELNTSKEVSTFEEALEGGGETPGEAEPEKSLQQLSKHPLRRRPHRRRSYGSADDELLAPLLGRKSSPSSSATSSNIDWHHCSSGPCIRTTTGSLDSYTEHELEEANGAQTKSSASKSNPSSSGPAPYDNQNTSGCRPADDSIFATNDTSSSLDGSTPPQPPPNPANPPNDHNENEPAATQTRLQWLLGLLWCSEALMFYIQSFQLCAISFQVACTTIYFASTPPSHLQHWSLLRLRLPLPPLDLPSSNHSSRLVSNRHAPPRRRKSMDLERDGGEH